VSAVVNLSRRRFLATSALAGGGLVLGVYVPALARQPGPARGATFAPNAFVRIGADDTVTVLVNHSEMGQGSYTSLPMLVAEELDADWKTVRAVAAPVAPEYNHSQYGIQMVGGSTSVRSEWERLRHAGAAARAMLVAAAAEMWGVAAPSCRTEAGHVISGARRASYGALAERASRLTPPAEVALKDPKDFRIIGRATKRLDTPEKVDGSAIFGIDVALPGMLVAVVARPPVFGGGVKRFDASAAQRVPGVRHVVAIDRGVAIVADGYWAAHQGRLALEVEWDGGPLAALDSAAQREQYAALARAPGAVARRDGDAAAALDGAAKKVEATYELPYLAHAPMEPINCAADVRADSCTVWTGTQFQTVDRMAAAQEAGLDPAKVTLHTTLLGGGFGRRAVMDSHFVREAVQISKRVQAPVKVIWSREDDTRGGYYRPAAMHSISAGLDERGDPVAWRQRIVCQSFIAGTPFESAIIHDGVDETAVEGASDLPYRVPNVTVDWCQAPGGVPTLWWRSVGHSHSAFAVESFVDELAHAAGRDPLDFRRGLLADHPRHAGALALAAEKAGWGQPLSAGRARGVAVHESFGSLVAYVAEVSVDRDGHVRVHRVVGAIDCGRVVNPDTVRAQMESGVVYGLTAALYGEITFAKGRVQQRNFHDYRMLRMHEMPRVESHIVPSTEALGGVGEPCVPPIAPAVANAIFAATGKRLRRLPFSPSELRAS
jgi:isoquinoline 1-oxidoreductase beta subunit